MATTKGRISLPRNPKDGFELAARIFAKHTTDGVNSELKNLDGLDWTVEGPAAADGLTMHNDAEKLKGEMEAMYRKRDAAFLKADAIVKASAAYLKGKYNKNPKKLAEWGFAIDDSKQVKKAKPTS